ncbi:MAG: DUF1566 domain-containing protein [Bacteroidetes bacterium]|nr:DUF1566 domain-containing protein [Bacteroidota bacterium]
MLEIKRPITGERLIVAESDFETSMNWKDAKNATNSLGAGWRLPTKTELELIHKELHLKGSGNFKSISYWSSTEYAGGNYAWYFGFGNGFSGNCSKDVKKFVRAVKVL